MHCKFQAWHGPCAALAVPSSEAAAQPSAWFQPLCTSQPSAASALGAPSTCTQTSQAMHGMHEPALRQQPSLLPAALHVPAVYRIRAGSSLTMHCSSQAWHGPCAALAVPSSETEQLSRQPGFSHSARPSHLLHSRWEHPVHALKILGNAWHGQAL